MLRAHACCISVVTAHCSLPFRAPLSLDTDCVSLSQVVLDKGIGKSRIVESQQARGSGYYCDVCDCVLKDSITYLDHINGKPRTYLNYF